MADASANDARVVTKTRLEKDLKPLGLQIAAYCQGLDAQDQQESGRAVELGGACELHAKLAKLKAQQARKQAQVKQLEDRGETQLWRTDPDARALRKAGQQTVGYNAVGPGTYLGERRGGPRPGHPRQGRSRGMTGPLRPAAATDT